METALPELAVTPDRTQVFMFSAATWNRHHIHFDKDAALAEGHAGVVVQRGLIGNFLSRLVTNWLGDRGEIRELSWKVVRSAQPNRTLLCQGAVKGEEREGARRFVLCELQAWDDQGQPVATGDAKVEFFAEVGSGGQS
jgi:hydroxyacyl-ACP dehydratase HTD2-like protein with hotdog domain